MSHPLGTAGRGGKAYIVPLPNLKSICLEVCTKKQGFLQCSVKQNYRKYIAQHYDFYQHICELNSEKEQNKILSILLWCTSPIRKLTSPWYILTFLRSSFSEVGNSPSGLNFSGWGEIFCQLCVLCQVHLRTTVCTCSPHYEALFSPSSFQRKRQNPGRPQKRTQHSGKCIVN